MEAREIADALADRAEAVCRTFLPNGRKVGNFWQVGNIDGDAGRSLTVRLHDAGGKRAGRWQDHATGDYGDLLNLIEENTHAENLWEAMKTASEFLGRPDPTPPTDRQSTPSTRNSKGDVSDKSDAGARLFSIGKAIRNTPAEAYLRGRSISRFGDALRYHPGVYLIGADGEQQSLPAMLAAITDNLGNVTGCARTWLDPVTHKLAAIDEPKRVLGRLYGNGVRFHAGIAPADQIIGEGIETLLSVGSALPDADLIACLTANHLSLYQPPERVKRLWVAHDNDAAGEGALAIIKERSQTEPFEVFPLPPIHNDHNDDLKALGLEAMADRLKRMIDAQCDGAFEPVF